MADGDDETQEPQDAAPEAPDEAAPQPKGRRRSFGKVRRELTEAELGSSGVQKMLLDELDRMDGSEADVKLLSDKYHETNTLLAVTREKLKTHNAFDIISTGTVALGSILFGAAFSFKDVIIAFWLMIILGAALVIVGIVAKVVRA